MKLLHALTILLTLSACTHNPSTTEENVKNQREYATADRNRAIEHGQLQGTPENLEGIKRANKQAESREREASRLESGGGFTNYIFHALIDWIF